MKITSFLKKLRHKKNPASYQDVWRANNRHNETVLLHPVADISRICVGRGSYGPLDVEMYGSTNRLCIGRYCSIGPHVHFILASEHPYTGLSTYPFKVKLGLQQAEARSKGDIIVEDDVWIGLGAIINSGVRIGKGSVIAAGSVVVKDVEPYSITGGNPARHIKYRFEKSIREKLLSLDFSLLNQETLKTYIDKVYEPLSPSNIDEILQIITTGRTGVKK